MASLPKFPDLDEGRPLINGVPAEALTTDGKQTFKVSFVSQNAAQDNALGSFALDASGNIVKGKILFPHSHDLERGDTKSAGSFRDGTQLGLFMIADGGFLLDDLPGKFRSARVSFENPSGGPANVFDDQPPDVALHIRVANRGNISVVHRAVEQPVFFTFDADPGSPLLNPLNDGGFTQTISGAGPRKAVRIGFDDLPLSDGDLDFQDLIVDARLSGGRRDSEDSRLTGVGEGSQLAQTLS